MEGAASMEDYDLQEALPAEFTREVELIPFYAAKVPKASPKRVRESGLELSFFLVGGKGGGAFKDTMGGGFEEMKRIFFTVNIC